MRAHFVGAWVFVAVFCSGGRAADNFPWEAEPFTSSPEATLGAAAQLPMLETAAVDILLDETKYEFDATRRVRTTHRQMYRLLTKDALDEWSVVTAEWSPWHEERPQIQVRVISTDGQAHVLDAGTISETPVEQSRQVLRDRRKLVAPLPAVEVGAVVELQIVTAEHRAFCEAGVFKEHFFYSSIPVRRMQLIVESPEQERPLHHRIRGIEMTPRQTAENGRLRMQFGPIPVGPKTGIEGFLPAELPLIPHVVIGNGSGWADVAQHYAKIVDQQIGTAPYLDAARSIVGNEQSRMAIVQKLLDAIQKRVRYVGIEFGESSIVPHPPHETLKVRYGDCKDQSTLMVALLRSLGHDAHVVLLRAGRNEDVLPEVPALNAFDHAIVHVPGDPTLWIDPTVPLLRVGELPLADMGRLALIASPATTELIRTPEPRPGENSLIRTRELVLATGARGRWSESLEYRGAYENQFRSFYAENKPEDIRGKLLQNLKQAYAIDRLSRFEFGEPRDLSGPFVVTYGADGVDHGIGHPACDVSLGPGSILDDVPWPLRQLSERQKSVAKGVDGADATWKRTAPLQFPMPFVKEMCYRVVLPIGFIAPKLPESYSKQFGPATISAGYAKESENVIVARFRFDSGSGRFSPDEAVALKEFLGQLHDGSNGVWLVTIHLEHSGVQQVAQGRIREGLVDFQRLLVEHPADVETRTVYAECLVSAGIGAAAREEARRATELDAKSSTTWQALGFTLMHDDFGRFMGHGIDPRAAEAALRKSVELDPTSAVPRWNLAVVLEYGTGPSRYAPGPRLKEAAEHYYKLRDQKYARPDLPTNLLWTLAHLDDWHGVINLASDLQPSLVRNSMWVAAVAATANVAAANRKAVELAGSDEARYELLLNSSDVLNSTRRYVSAAEMVECSLPLITDPEYRKRIQAFATAVKKMKRIDDAYYPEGDPRRLVQQLHVAAFTGASANSVSPLLVEDAPQDAASVALEIIRSSQADVIRAAIKTKKTSQRMGDATSVVEFKFEGDAVKGYRVTSKNLRWYVVKRNGELRLLLPGLQFSELGREALRFLQSNDVEGARRWLEWAAVELPPPAGFFADSFSASPFGFLWNGLKSDQLKVAAAMLAAPGGQSDEGLRILLEFRESSTSKTQQLQVDRALAQTFAARNDWERLLEPADRLLVNHKTSEDPVQWKRQALKRLDRMNELREFEDQRVSQMKGSARAMLEGMFAANRGDFELSQKLLRQLADSPKAEEDPVIFNEVAWIALFMDQPALDAALRYAVKANELTKYRSTEPLHTLATVYAERDEATEAMKILMQAIEARDGKTANVDFYVLGRIAESYGLNTIAAGHYAQVESSETLNSTYHLAQRRLKRLRPAVLDPKNGP